MMLRIIRIDLVGGLVFSGGVESFGDDELDFCGGLLE